MADEMTLAEAAPLLGLSPETLRNQVAAGRLEARKIGKTWVTTSAAIEAYRQRSLGRPGRRSWNELKASRAARPIRPRYEFTAERDGSGWLVKAVDLERVFTQVKRLDQAEEMARSVTSLMLDVDKDAFDVHIEPRLPEPLGELVRRARDKRETADELQARAASLNAATIRRLLADDYAMADVATLLGMSPGAGRAAGGSACSAARSR